MQNIKPRYPLASVTTTDIELVKRANAIRKLGYTHETIYRVGLEQIEKQQADSPGGKHERNTGK